MSIEQHNMSADDPRAMFAKAYVTAGQIIDQVTDADLHRPTPCDDYDVERLLTHLLMVGERVACAGLGEDPMKVGEVSPPSDRDWLATWHSTGHRIQSAWTDAAALDRIVVLPWAQRPGGETLMVYMNELTAHTWDLAKSIDAQPAWNMDVLAAALATTKATLPGGDRVAMLEAIRPNLPAHMQDMTAPFANPVELADDAPLIDQVVAWVGRDPGWTTTA